MRSATALTALAAAAAILAGADAPAASTVRARKVQSITIDGDISDWKDVPLHYLDSGPRVTAIAHDGRFLYVHFRFADLALARRVLHSGAIVWFNGDGGREAGFGLRYRGTPELEAALKKMDGSGDAPPGGGPSARGPALKRPPLGALEVLHKGAVDEVIASGSKPDGVAAACGMADGAFAYELRVPLADINAAPNLAGSAPSGKIAVGFQMGGVTQAERKAMREQMESGGGSGGGRRGGFGDRHGGPPGGDAPGDFPGGGVEGRMHTAQPVWVDVELAEAEQPAAPAGK